MEAKLHPHEENNRYLLRIVGNEIRLENRELDEWVFTRFNLGPPTPFSPGLRVVENVHFRDCIVEHGPEFRLASVIRNVTFDNVKWSQQLKICSTCVFENVVFSGGTPVSEIRVNDDARRDEFGALQSEHIERAAAKRTGCALTLDVRDFSGAVNVHGWPIDSVRYNPSQCVRLHAGLLDTVPWGSLEADSRRSLWYFCVRRLSRSPINECLVAVPRGRSKAAIYDRRVLDALRERAFVE